VTVDEALAGIYPSLLRSLEASAGGPFVAGILLDGELVGKGTNTVLRDSDVTRHAEMNALSDTGRALGRVQLDRAVLVTSHLPCLMCYNALKWARISEAHFVFDYGETDRIFGFRGDARMLLDLGIGEEALRRDATMRLVRAAGPSALDLYRGSLAKLWNESYRARLGTYDV